MLGFLYQAGEVDGPETFTEPVLDAFFKLPGADSAAGVEFGGRDPAAAADELIFGRAVDKTVPLDAALGDCAPSSRHRGWALSLADGAG